MNHLKNIAIFVLPLLVYAGLWFLVYPFFKYNLDADAVGYLTVAERVANGNWHQSVNGLWSPLNSWILVPFIRFGYEPWLVACYSNFVVGAIVLSILYFFLRHYISGKWIRFFISLTFSIIMVNYVFYQMFGDVLLLLLLLLLTLLFQKNSIDYSYFNAVLIGLIVGVATLAKTYAFVFFLIFSISWGFWLVYNKQFSVSAFLKKQGLALLVSLCIILPWSFQLSKKYGENMLLGTAGKMNLSWQINSGKTFNDSINLLIPPPYSDSPCFWEDPYLSQDNLSTPFTSLFHFLRWIARIVHTTLTAVGCYLEISALSFFIIALALYYLFKVVPKIERKDKGILLLICLSMPLGYLAMHIETRYIWFCSILLITIGGQLIEQYIKPALHLLTASLLCLSFLVSPILQFDFLKNKNKELFEWSEKVEKNNIHGSFTSNTKTADRFFVVAYLTKNQFYTIEKSDYSLEELYNEMRRYKVSYLFYETQESIAPIQWKDSLAAKKWEYVTTIDDIQVMKLK